MAGKDPIEIYQGEDVTLDFTMNPVIDITGWTLLLTVKGGFTAGGSVVSGPLGTFTVALTDDNTDSLIPRKYLYDVWRTDSGSERVLARGEFKVVSVARDTT